MRTYVQLQFKGSSKEIENRLSNMRLKLQIRKVT